MTQASLATVYALVLLLMRFDFVASRAKGVDSLNRFVLAIKHSARTFLDTSIVFSLAMLMAACFVFIDRLEERKGMLTRYTLFCTVLLSIYTILPALLLHICISDSLRRRRGRRILWVVVWLASITVFALWKAIVANPKAFECAKGVEYHRMTDAHRRILWNESCIPSMYLPVALKRNACIRYCVARRSLRA